VRNPSCHRRTSQDDSIKIDSIIIIMGRSFNMVDYKDQTDDDDFEQHYELVDDPNQDDFSFSSAEEEENEHDNGKPDDNDSLFISCDHSSLCPDVVDDVVVGSSSYLSSSHPWTLVTAATSLSDPSTNHSTRMATPKYHPHSDRTKSTAANSSSNTVSSAPPAATNDPPGSRSLDVDENELEQITTTLHAPIQTDKNTMKTSLPMSCLEMGHTTSLSPPNKDDPLPTLPPLLLSKNILYKTTSYILASHHAKRQGRLLLVHVLPPPPNEKENDEHNTIVCEHGCSSSSSLVLKEDYCHDYSLAVLYHLLTTQFVVWQCTAQSPGGLHFAQNYPVSCYPHLSILDPQSGGKPSYLPRLLACREGCDWRQLSSSSSSTQQQQQQRSTGGWTAQEMVEFLTLDHHPSAEVGVVSLLSQQLPSKQHWPNKKEKQDHKENDKSESLGRGAPQPASSLSLLSLSLQQQQ
jgi:hypothetical protein